MTLILCLNKSSSMDEFVPIVDLCLKSGITLVTLGGFATYLQGETDTYFTECINSEKIVLHEEADINLHKLEHVAENCIVPTEYKAMQIAKSTGWSICVEDKNMRSLAQQEGIIALSTKEVIRMAEISCSLSSKMNDQPSGNQCIIRNAKLYCENQNILF